MSDSIEQNAIITNRLMWDDRVEAHWKSVMYRRDADALRGGGHCLRDEVVEAVGDVAGKSLIHLQCHMGMETLSWARLGADVMGLDFSRPALDKAELLRDELGLEASFVFGNIYDAPKLVDRKFDVVFQSIGSLCWLPDLEGWSRVVAGLLNPGGKYVLEECHPFISVIEDPPGATHLEPMYPYFHDEPLVFNDGGDYADPDGTFTHNRSFEWVHPLGDVLTRLIEAGLTIDRLTESPRCVFPRYRMMEQTGPGDWELPGQLRGKLPMSYILTAHKP